MGCSRFESAGNHFVFAQDGFDCEVNIWEGRPIRAIEGFDMVQAWRQARGTMQDGMGSIQVEITFPRCRIIELLDSFEQKRFILVARHDDIPVATGCHSSR